MPIARKFGRSSVHAFRCARDRRGSMWSQVDFRRHLTSVRGCPFDIVLACHIHYGFVIFENFQHHLPLTIGRPSLHSDRLDHSFFHHTRPFADQIQRLWLVQSSAGSLYVPITWSLPRKREPTTDGRSRLCLHCPAVVNQPVNPNRVPRKSVGRLAGTDAGWYGGFAGKGRAFQLHWIPALAGMTQRVEDDGGYGDDGDVRR
ncbi:hypothetical protein EDC27_3046 [Desulfosoma caldarium]|uniref:Uncharacterized protein n=1 Tax=Desulfosoma caldarium TaxID=610254 RepID=A0A3N1UII3_9BACT|nr:hypothetical protein EDC27_3046 [Desulfosoma caldarium]